MCSICSLLLHGGACALFDNNVKGPTPARAAMKLPREVYRSSPLQYATYACDTASSAVGNGRQIENSFDSFVLHKTRMLHPQLGCNSPVYFLCMRLFYNMHSFY
jgi:hypothetical protein